MGNKGENKKGSREYQASWELGALYLESTSVLSATGIVC